MPSKFLLNARLDSLIPLIYHGIFPIVRPIKKMPRIKVAQKELGGFKRIDSLYCKVSAYLENARKNVERSVNTEMVRTYWLIGQAIVEEEQCGEERAEYGSLLIEELSARLTTIFGKGFGVATLKNVRQFYLTYSDDTATYSDDTASRKGHEQSQSPLEIHYPLCSESQKGHALNDQSQKSYTLCSQSQTSHLNPNLSWAHYRELMRVSRPLARSFYEIETVQNNWSVRELKRQIGSLLFDRLAKSKDKEGLLALACKGQEINKPEDAIKEPFVLEFLGIPESNRLVESNLEDALISNLQHFLLELGNGFAFVARQKRLTLDGDHFYADLVFYHITLKCYVIIELKTQALTHGDLGQMQLYVNYFDLEIKKEDDNPTVGLILCTDKNDAMVKYTLGTEDEKIFASKYQLHLPTEAELEAELKREVKAFQSL